ncbi:hypothetical protein [Aeromonas dhakensis]|uniref:hypothetical protein n=1 Tax=Aeromonas dhakensis TaxID=196024 RepID=UPI0024483B90|nr:hypothetical protein [Aeromonas dhakensis]MDH0348138.1 hypothetical protein [Aeromonas dhakensis]
MTAKPATETTLALMEAIRGEFGDEYSQVMAALSVAATRYAEESVPAVLIALPVQLQAYLNHGVTVGFRYQGLASLPIKLLDAAGVFPAVSQIPLQQPIVCPRYPAVFTLDLQTPAGVAVDAAFAAMEELLDRVSRRASEFTTTLIEKKVPHG